VNESDLIDQIIKAAARHKMVSRGQPLPGGYEEHIAKLRKSSVPWTRIFARLAKQTFKKASDRNPFKPDPKYLPFDVFIPTEISIGVPKVVLIVDTSGSMNSEEFECALGHIEKVCAICEKVTVITSDETVQETVKIKNLKKQLMDDKILFKGRGGTDMTDAFEAADKLRPDLIILYSDLLLPFYPKKPRAPVIFLSRDLPYEKPPYGSYIHVKDLNAE
ncbi:MAG TPA: VWA-like domain-containing protein, partial [Anaerovoracaceae bacterium]|nr:VWA-like domain-containing protein [Anaerovoracaceae bacterium]